MAQLELRDLVKDFKTGRAVDGLTLDVDAGEIVAIFGPSGAGKTVLLRIISGIEEPEAGQVQIGGRDATQDSPEARGIGIAFQNFALFPHMTAYDNVATGLTATGASKDAIKARVDGVAKMLKISHVMGHKPKELSNGQKQRTALARALVASPKILLLDDPLRNVDAKLRYEMRLELPALLRRSGSAVLYVTQDYKEAMALADRIAVMIDGRVVQVDEPETVYTSPATVEIARLFGDPTINLLPWNRRATARGSPRPSPTRGCISAEASMSPMGKVASWVSDPRISWSRTNRRRRPFRSTSWPRPR